MDLLSAIDRRGRVEQPVCSPKKRWVAKGAITKLDPKPSATPRTQSRPRVLKADPEDSFTMR